MNASSLISKQVSKIILLSLILNVLHMIEVVWSNFPTIAYGGIANKFSSLENAVYYSSHIPLYILLTIFFLSHAYPKTLKWCLVGYSWVFISESHHFIHALLIRGYYPGAITSFLYIVLGYFYVRQLRYDFHK